MRRINARLIAVAALVLLILQVTSVAAAPRRIRIKHGHTSARVKGRLRNIHDDANFVLRARAGQHLKVTINGQGPTRGAVTSPGGQALGGGPGGVVFDDNLPATGDYRIRVTESQMADEWKGTFILKVNVH